MNRLILVAEEDPVIRTFLADNLTADGYEMLIAEDRDRALRVLEADRPDLVVCDVNSETLSLLDAVRNGDGVASRIDPDTPLIVLTSHTDELSRLRYFDRGSDDVIAKPFSYHELRARVRALLARAYERNRGQLRIGAAHDRSDQPPGVLARQARGARGQGVRAAADADLRADARVHEGRAVARCLGLPRPRLQSNAGLATRAACVRSCAARATSSS